MESENGRERGLGIEGGKTFLSLQYNFQPYWKVIRIKFRGRHLVAESELETHDFWFFVQSFLYYILKLKFSFSNQFYKDKLEGKWEVELLTTLLLYRMCVEEQRCFGRTRFVFSFDYAQTYIKIYL